jgi:hypothetical protein
MKNYIFKAVIGIFLLLNTVAFSQTRRESEEVIINENGDTTRTKTITIYQEEEVTPARHMIYLDPFAFFINYNLGYMQMVSEKIALGGVLTFPAQKDISGIGIDLEGRFYPGGKGLEGFYVSPRFSYSNISGSDNFGSTVSIAGLIGWQWHLAKDFSLRIGVGYERFLSRIEGSEPSVWSEVYGNGAPAVRLDIGYVW